MKKTIALAVVLLAVAAVAGHSVSFVYAEEAATQQTKATAASGEIVSVDTANQTIVIKQVTDAATGATEEITVTVSSETKISKGETALMLSDLKAQDKIAIAYKEGTTTAETITVE